LTGESDSQVNILHPAGRTFSALYKEPSRIYKAEDWVVVWTSMIGYLASAQSLTVPAVDEDIAILVDVVCDGLREALHTTQNGKKVSQRRQ